MNRAVIDFKLRDVVIRKLGVSDGQVCPEASFISDLGADSIDMFDLYMEVESEFNIDEIDDYLRSKVKTFCDLGDCVESIVNANKVGGKI